MITRPGDTVEDEVTGFKGRVVARTEYLNGCFLCEVQPRVAAGNKWVQSRWIDEPQLVVVKAKKKEAAVVKSTERKGGPGNTPLRSLPPRADPNHHPPDSTAGGWGREELERCRSG